MSEMQAYHLPATLRTGPPSLGNWPRRLASVVIFGLAIVVALVSYRYLADEPSSVPSNIASNAFRPLWLATHAGFGATALLIGAAQFSSRLRRGRPSVHRYVGRVYVVASLIGAAAGFVLAMGASSGPVASAGFGLLAIVWIVTNILGWQTARAGDFAAHRRWMIRSWALTLSAVTLRLYIPIGQAFGLPDLTAYRAIAFLCWVPNLLAAELLLRRGAARPRPATV